jgi:hypothetical protein
MGGSSKGKGGDSPEIPKEFEFLLPIIQQMMSQGLAESGAFSGALPGLANVQGGMDAAGARNQLGFGTAGGAMDMWNAASGALQSGLGGGFAQLPSDLLGDFEAQFRPGVELSKESAAASTLSDSASAGRTRSQGTTESLARGNAGIEAGFQENLAGVVSSVLPSIIQGQLGGISQGLGAPGQSASLLQQQIMEAFQGTQFGLSLPSMNAAGAGGLLGGMPIDPGEQGKGKGGKTAGIAQLGGAVASLWPVIAGAGATAAPAAAAACWTARQIYGERNPKWTQIRNWLLYRASNKMRNLYLKTGEKVAAFIATRPELQADLKRHFDTLIVEV